MIAKENRSRPTTAIFIFGKIQAMYDDDSKQKFRRKG